MLIILALGTACQATLVTQQPVQSATSPLPTFTAVSITSLPPTLFAAATRDTRAVPSLMPDASAEPLPAATAIPALPAISPSTVITPLPGTPSLISSTAPAATSTALPVNSFTLGYSVQGRAIVGQRFGEGAAVVLLVGGIHGGWESNTVALMHELIAHFTITPSDIPSGVSLVIVPTINPDGQLYDRSVEGRFNANGVDLNRNWGCGWSPRAVFQARSVNPGGRAFSEPETMALAVYIREVHPAAALFYHSAANGVFGGSCEGGTSGERSSATLEALYGEAAGYAYGAPFTAYPVTGTAPSWLDGQGIPAADVELSSWEDTEFERNLRAVQAVLVWVGEG